jgi:membrane protease subunit (stomatin/prohibitin family)
MAHTMMGAIGQMGNPQAAAPVAAAPAAAPAAAGGASPDTKFCVECGARIARAAKFCSECGKSQA